MVQAYNLAEKTLIEEIRKMRGDIVVYNTTEILSLITISKFINGFRCNFTINDKNSYASIEQHKSFTTISPLTRNIIIFSIELACNDKKEFLGFSFLKKHMGYVGGNLDLYSPNNSNRIEFVFINIDSIITSEVPCQIETTCSAFASKHQVKG